jgi:hypothetical protein
LEPQHQKKRKKETKKEGKRKEKRKKDKKKGYDFGDFKDRRRYMPGNKC